MTCTQLDNRAHGHPQRPARRMILMLGVCIAALASSGSLAQEAGRIEAVTLSSSGLAEIRRNIAVDGGKELAFDIPLEQVDDVLKSLLVYDPAGGVSSIILDSLSPVEETFRGLPFTAGDMGDLPRLIGALQGISVRITSEGRAVEGVVLGVSEPPLGRDGENQPRPLASLLTDAGAIEVVALGETSVLDILDPTVLDDVRLAAAVSGRGRVEGRRTITLALEEATARDVDVSYVVAAPIWKTAYRVVVDNDGSARLQAWAVIENASGQDWDGVELTLSSGMPVTLTQRLHERYWPTRPEIPVLAQAIAPVRPDLFGGNAVARAGSIAMADSVANFEAATPQAAPAPASPSYASSAAQGYEADAAATYRLPMPVDLPAGRTLSVPFVDAHLPAERVSLFQPERGEVHPVAALRLDNTTGTSLPAGIATIYAPQEEGYSGDTQLAMLPAGESRMISFASDHKVEVTTETGQAKTSYRATLAEGVLRVNGTTRIDTVYTVSGAPDAPRTVIVEQPRRDGWTFSSDDLTASTPTHYRLETGVGAGESARITARFERTAIDAIALVDTDAANLLYWAGEIDDLQTAAALTELAERRQAIARIEATAADIGQEIAIAIDEQDRIRANLEAVANTALAERYFTMLEAQEDRIAELNAKRRQAQQDLTAAQEALSRAIASL
ncbi:MAG TPA: DUF4139 domain-containing protein [Pelagibacterium sp.]|uniref:DUF4139 domain-containing protein n=1 Tax=Pelagibacterium sp. TaxID=1967288 RepID=UPI002CE37BC1|nr:DUF4139 domain-containing protein [Pelagibacterium sp.]HWJ89390.1 DUF4139 domain-containing protein [Pelagibacterium sp.]